MQEFRNNKYGQKRLTGCLRALCWQPQAKGNFCHNIGKTHQHCASLQVNILDNALVEVDGFELPIIEASEPVLDAKDLVRRYAIVFKSEHNVLDDIIQPRAQATTSHHCCCHLYIDLRLDKGVIIWLLLLAC